MNETHIMIDTESLGIGNTAAIISIGAIVFNPFAFLPSLGESFEAHICPGLVESAGFSVEQETIDWWNQEEQAEAAKISLTGEMAPEEAIHLFADWMNQQGDYENRIVWSKGIDFDLVKLNHFFQTFGIETPWHYQNQMDARTAINLAKRKGFNPDTHAPSKTMHTALGDARNQAYQLCVSNYFFGLNEARG